MAALCFTRRASAVACVTVGSLYAAAVLVLGSSRQVSEPQDGRAFVVTPIQLSSQLGRGLLQPTAGRPGSAGAMPEASSSSGAIAAASALAAVAVVAATRRSSAVARRGTGSQSQAGGEYAWSGHQWERKWWSIEETRDPTTLPLWQRDLSYGWAVLRKTMVAARKRGAKVFWDVRVVKTFKSGCTVEMLNSGLLGFCKITQEGPKRLEIGQVVKMECTSCPTKSHHKEGKFSVWPAAQTMHPKSAQFSHKLYLEQQLCIEKSKDLVAGDIVEGWVTNKLAKGLLINLDGPGYEGSKGFLSMTDISRKMSNHLYVHKMFPHGTKMRCYVVHSDTTNGRITLSTKEFEDDDHMGWMLSFPERMMFKNAEEGVRLYHEKRDAWIAFQQR